MARKKHGKAPKVATTSAGQQKGPDAAPAQAHGVAEGSQRELDEGMAQLNLADKVLVAKAQLRAVFYPKFENEKSDSEVRSRMISLVGAGAGVLEVSEKHSGSLFMWSGGGRGFAKNSWGNEYSAVGLFVVARTLRDAWGPEQGPLKQQELSRLLQEKRLCVAMELVTAVLGDHGQRPKQDYVVVTAVADLSGQPLFYSTPEVVRFCREWRLPSNQYWLFSSKESAQQYFQAYDMLQEEGIASSVVAALNDIADVAVPGTRDHREVQGEILEGLVGRLVSPSSAQQLQEVVAAYPLPAKPTEVEAPEAPTLREIFEQHQGSEKERVQKLLRVAGPKVVPDAADWQVADTEGSESSNSMFSKFMDAYPADHNTFKLREILNTLTRRKLRVRFKCVERSFAGPSQAELRAGALGALKDPTLTKQFTMTVHVLMDSTFRIYQKQMREQPELWPLYRGFFVDVSLMRGQPVKDRLKEAMTAVSTPHQGESCSGSEAADTVVEPLMLKMKFLPYKLRTFLIRNGLGVLSGKGKSAYLDYCKRQLKQWGTSPDKTREMIDLCSSWASHVASLGVRVSSNGYLDQAEPFLAAYAQKSPHHARCVGASDPHSVAGGALNVHPGGHEEEGFHMDDAAEPSTSNGATKQVAPRNLVVFFPGIPGCAKSALCRELVTESAWTAGKPVESFMSDTFGKKGYWKVLGDKVRKGHKEGSVMLADKNAPTWEVWDQIGSIAESANAVAVPVLAASEGTESNPYSLDALAVFMQRVLARENHPGRLDMHSTNPGYVLLMFYNLYEGRSRADLEEEMLSRYGAVVQMPLLRDGHAPVPTPVIAHLKEGLQLYSEHVAKHGKMESSKGSLKGRWEQWESKLRLTIKQNEKALQSMQVPFLEAVASVRAQLAAIAAGDYTPASTGPRLPRRRTTQLAAIKCERNELVLALGNLARQSEEAHAFMRGKDFNDKVSQAHVTLAHKLEHGVAAVAAFTPLQGTALDVRLKAFLFSKDLAAWEVDWGEEQKTNGIRTLNQFPHITVWTGNGAKAKDANKLPQLEEAGEAKRVALAEPIVVNGVVDFM